MFERILVATDGSELARKAVASAIAMASQNAAELVIFTAVPQYPHSYFEGARVYAPCQAAQIEAQWAEAAHSMLETAAAEARAQGIAVRTATAGSDLVADAIVAAARKYGSDLIVMASHGRSGLKRLLLGSETLSVLSHSTVPVLVLR